MTPPSRPSGITLCPPPVPAGDTRGVVGLCWSASTDDVGVTGYEVYRLDTGGFVKAASPTGTITVISGLIRSRVYTFYIVAKDAAGNTSEPSALVNATAVTGVYVSPTPTPGDTTPPSRPAGLRDGCAYDFRGTSFCWNPSTDDVGVTRYDVYRQTATGYLRAGTTTSPFFVEGGLVTGRTYTYFVVAEDAAGNLSLPSDLLAALAREGFPTPSPSPSPTPTPTPTPTPQGCAVTYADTSWSTGFTASVTITNTGAAPIDGWTLRFAFPSTGQRLTQGWSATWSQSGSAVTAVNMPWNAVIRPGASVQIGFNGAHTGADPHPAAFTLNGTACSTA
ncbi:cellulose binding domain-containing protein [Microbispora sp. ATCC PTA-5024]|uniref:cellulose binding domain-containing protein n=1 Tax=Microbispora sp. ATCC PTA-5024 TaxID=316330 RepID=UPI000402FBE7|nr:cellulose binding domain-containing protein [Microbispora sp. ATCC PTA-5024]